MSCSLQTQIRWHAGDVCSKEFSMSCNFKTHIRTLTCDIYVLLCSKGFSMSLQTQFRTHIGDKPYECDKGF